MSETPTNRRLAAILAADVVGYSRMMAADEVGTLSALKRHREEVFEPAVGRHNGRTFKLIGDGTLVEFASVVDAVKCALDIQTTIAAEPEDDSSSPRIRLRIGVNLGDVIFEGDDVYGDGVNVAARLEPLADTGGVCVSGIVNESIGGRLDATFVDGGDVEVKNIRRPVRIWKWHPDTARDEPAAAAAAPPSAPDLADGEPGLVSVAVLPFDNMSGDPEQEYFSDGISEDIITDLSKVGGLLVIARNSSFVYKGKSVDLRTVGRELGANSILEGSIRRAGNRVRINAQLIDAATGGHLWADRYDRDLTDIFEVQDEVTRHIVGALKVALTPAEEARITAPVTSSSEAHDCYLRGREIVHKGLGNRENFEQAVGLFERAIELDPNYSDPYAALSMAYNFDYFNRWSGGDPEGSLERSRQYADRAVELEPDSPFAHYAASVAHAVSGDRERGYAETKKALELNPNFALALNALGAFRIFDGEPAAAIPDIEKAIQLDPAHAQQYLHFLGMAHLLLGNYETAAASFRERIMQFPETDVSRALLASALGHLGDIEEARRAWDELMSVNPRYTFARHMSNLRFQDDSARKILEDGLTKAGLPTT